MLTGTHWVSIKRVFVTGVGMIALEPAVRELDAALFPFLPSAEAAPIFSISEALSCGSLQPLTPITRKLVAETALCIAHQFTGASSALTLSTTERCSKNAG
ncbi:hypothetical protein ACNKHM_29605 [Shigella sonnei]